MRLSYHGVDGLIDRDDGGLERGTAAFWRSVFMAAL